MYLFKYNTHTPTHPQRERERYIYTHTHTCAQIFAQDIHWFVHCGVSCQHVSTKEIRQESRVARLKQAPGAAEVDAFDVPKIVEDVSMGREQALQQNVEQVGLKRKSRTLEH